jgi:DNA-binding transcriptional MerR regulator
MGIKPPKARIEFHTREVEILSGLSKHMVDYLCRHGVLSASFSSDRHYGKRRRFSFTDVLLARSIQKLLHAGISVLSMRRALLELYKQLNSNSPSALRDRRIIIRGGIPYLSLPAKPPLNLLAGGQMAFTFVLEIEDLWLKAEPLVAQRQAALVERIQRAQKKRQERLA